MTKRGKILSCIFVLLSFCFICVGYAAVSKSLSVSATIDLLPFEYEGVVITEVSLEQDSTINSESHSFFTPTNLKSTINGAQGQKVIYKITAHNYSKENDYIFNGIKYSDVYIYTLNKMEVSVGADKNGNQQFSTTPSTQVVSAGMPIAPGEDFVFYAVYTLNQDIADEEVILNFSFDRVMYTITYLNGNETYAIDHIIDNQQVYYVRTSGPANQGKPFGGWINANAVEVQSYPKGNQTSYTLSATWENLYLIMFVDESGAVLYEEIFSDSSTKLSASGQQTVDNILKELQAEAAVDDMTVAWSDYNIESATTDIIVRPIYTYTGMLSFTPVDRDSDGIIDYYQIDAVSKLNDPVKIPGKYRGLPVEVVNKLYKNDNNYDFGAGIKTIEIGEGVTTINHNALAYTSDLSTVKLPNSLETLGKNVFSRNTGADKKVLTIEFNGTMAEWQTIVANSHDDWHNGLKDGSVVKCSDGYFELDRGILGLGGYNWKQKYY